MRFLTLLTLSFAFFIGTLHAQNDFVVGSNYPQGRDIGPVEARDQFKLNQRIRKWIRENGENYRAGGITTIPVVFHVLYHTTDENIPDSLIYSQMDVLNADFRRLNADTVNTPAAFDSLMADCEIEFCFAQRTPDGDPTTGIVRKYTAAPHFNWWNQTIVYYDSLAGAEAWPRDQYLNIWVCNRQSSYALPPGSSPQQDGIVMSYRDVGVNNPASVHPPGFNHGRIGTRLVGTWLGLQFVYGSSYDCSGDDQISDTPPQYRWTSGCPSYPLLDSCSPNPPGAMFMNFMDYTDGICRNGFTQGQSARMQAVLATDRLPITNSNGCVPVQLFNNDAWAYEISSPSGLYCDTIFEPEFVLFNRGANTLTSLDIHWQINNGPVQTLPWTGSLPSVGTTTISLPGQSLATGNYDLLIYTSNPNGVPDDDPTNDTLSHSFFLNNTLTSPVSQMSIYEGFDTSLVPPPGWALNNPDNDKTWEWYNGGGSSGSNSCIRMNFYDYTAVGERDELIFPNLDFIFSPRPQVIFEVSYRLFSMSGASDTLRMEISSNCGATWTTVFEEYGQSLTTVTPYYDSTAWEPTTNFDWKSHYVDLASYAYMSDIQMRFVAINGHENNLYLDRIVVAPNVGVEEELTEGAMTLSPNPGHDFYQMDIELPSVSLTKIRVLNMVGQEVWQTERKAFKEGIIELDLSGRPAGIYLVKLETSKGSMVKKLIRQ